MVDPLTEVVTLLQPAARFSKQVVGAGDWKIDRTDVGQPFYCVVLEGGCTMTLMGQDPILLAAGDFVLVPAAFRVELTSFGLETDVEPSIPVEVEPGVFRIGEKDGPPNLRILAGHCSFGSPDAELLVSLLPQCVHVRGDPRLRMLVELASEETRGQRPAREAIVSRLLEVLLIEALRISGDGDAAPGLVRGLNDVRVAAAVRAIHAAPSRDWTVAELAAEASMSRSAFFGRFSRAVGVPPMEYLLGWRMALAKDLLRRGEGSVALVAERIGYSSSSTFSTAFTRHVGVPPSHYARDQST